jgi:hypothetical protein
MTQPDPAADGNPGFAFSPQDAMAFMQRMWNPFGMAIPGFTPPGGENAAAAAGMPGMPPGFPFPNPAAMFATIDPAEIERKISELKVIEGWLTMSLSMMQMSIRTMELQKASLEALRAGSAAVGSAAEPKAAPRRKP